MRSTILVILASLLCLPMIARSQPVDPHALFEEKCGRCHEHAGAFALETLSIEDDEVVSQRSGKRVLDTLNGHFGKLDRTEADLIVDMFRRQIVSGGVYKAKCRICHDPAKDLARQTLIIRQGQLIGRYSGCVTEDFLNDHGRLQGNERRVVLDMLTWQLTTDDR